MVKSHLETSCEVVSEHNADQTFKVVSAASIVAKVTRDRAITALSKKYGEIGSGILRIRLPLHSFPHISMSTNVPRHCKEKLEDRHCHARKKQQSQLSQFF